MPAKRLTLADVKITVTPEEEFDSPSQGYPGTDRKEKRDFVQAVEEMIDRFGLWGWCSVRVSAALGPLRGDAYLGQCSYEGEADFRSGGYFEQMADEALADLQQQIDDLYPLIHED